MCVRSFGSPARRAHPSHHHDANWIREGWYGKCSYSRVPKRSMNMNRTDGGTMTTKASDATTADAHEPRVVAFAEQLGRVVGTVQAKAEGWLDREALKKQIVGVRDRAADLLQGLSADAPNTPPKKTTKNPDRSPRRAQGRSGGMVDAPGK